ncbi:hypothetical protein CONPUDRAFT_130769 [Coniophora puteana RWD-64-598 SS2]|uniref:uS12 prolyl 3,4-dihydroxylase n=1 Tax=Coniophora puteana (strain RWD-64-598) TaxID=741705 RepID=A0A5M3MC85_CONPW|nr:uncharacterized protein CONPUDRAFT_130769 [Coniophora puteana RWD-64-598 SS2]EIW76255.1 hypothetical protein CONPUDRAFT_130769 [Coniophora puteana RWD-64-598 SS2]
MAVHERSPSPTADSQAKKLKTDPVQQFHDGLLEPESIQKLRNDYTTSEPYKYAVIETLFQDDLLRKVKDECMKELSFSEKETDIYKVNQTGDLASLNFITPEQLAVLPNLLLLRDALYSPAFRAFIQSVTGCGALSGTKQDMSVNNYTKGCHLLNHDDVIGSRRVSYILYMPLPCETAWQKEWGGALELYPTRVGEGGVSEPEAAPSKAIPPSWNQFIFFEVQPGKSFHSVEEVVIDGEERSRLSISGWFHAAQEGEEGHEPASSTEHKSSREQLTSSTTVFSSYAADPPHPEAPLSEEHRDFLLRFMNPVYLQLRTMKTLMAHFVEESSIEFNSFLNEDLVNRIETGVKARDKIDGLDDKTRNGTIPPHTAGTGGAWEVQGPPHKWRYCTLRSRAAIDSANRNSASASENGNGKGKAKERDPEEDQAEEAESILRALQDQLFPSQAFRAWLGAMTHLLPLRHSLAARRFRPGLDYTLATSEEGESRLDAVLCLTPFVPGSGTSKYLKNKAVMAIDPPKAWVSGQWGGWECYMAPHEEEDDPAVYRSGPSKEKGKEKEKEKEKDKGKGKEREVEPPVEGSGSKMDTDEDGDGADGDDEYEDVEDEEEEEHEDGEDEEDEEGAALLTSYPGFNRLLLVLRDEGVLRFVKYVSAAAEGSRWDVCGEYEVGMIQDESDEEEMGADAP